MTERVQAPRWLAEHAEAFQASGAQPAAPRLAATIVLLRPAEAPADSAPQASPELRGFEVYVQRRAATMAFAPGMYAFPGGSVDRTDYDQAWSGDAVAARLGLAEEDARAVLHAAVRELDEEAGVALGVDALAPWARWLTPEFEPRRYDTFFFVARLPQHQHPRQDGGESDHVAWLPPADALALPMLPPTHRTIVELAEFSDIDGVLAASAGRDVSRPLCPVIEVDEGGAWLRLK